MKTETTSSVSTTDMGRDRSWRTIFGLADVAVAVCGLFSSDQKRNPARPHLLHVSGVLRVSAQKIFFDQALDRDEPKHAQTHQQRIQRTESAQHECDVGKEDSGVDGVAHEGIGATVHKLAL